MKEIRKGMFYLTQAILVPEEKLIPGKTYALKLDHHIENNSTWKIKWDDKLSIRQPALWKVESRVNIQPPVFNDKPTYTNTQCEYYGCGPSAYANFNISTGYTSSFLVLTELVEIETGTSHQYYLNLNKEGTLSVGHGMCSGAFNYKDKGKFVMLNMLKFNSIADYSDCKDLEPKNKIAREITFPRQLFFF